MKQDLAHRYQPVLDALCQLPFVKAVIIFGSYAKGETKFLSDLDVCVVTYTTFPEDEVEKVYGYGNEKLDISLFHHLPLPHQYEVMEFGKIYHTKEDLTELRYDILNQWIDFRPYLIKAYKNRGYPINI